MHSHEEPPTDAAAGSSSCEHCDHDHEGSKAESISLIVSGVLVAAALLLHRFDGLSRWITAATAIAAMLAGGWFLLPKAWRAVLRLRPDINLLVVIAAVGASIIGEVIQTGSGRESLVGWPSNPSRAGCRRTLAKTIPA